MRRRAPTTPRAKPPAQPKSCSVHVKLSYDDGPTAAPWFGFARKQLQRMVETGALRRVIPIGDVTITLRRVSDELGFAHIASGVGALFLLLNLQQSVAKGGARVHAYGEFWAPGQAIKAASSYRPTVAEFGVVSRPLLRVGETQTGVGYRTWPEAQPAVEGLRGTVCREDGTAYLHFVPKFYIWDFGATPYWPITGLHQFGVDNASAWLYFGEGSPDDYDPSVVGWTEDAAMAGSAAATGMYVFEIAQVYEVRGRIEGAPAAFVEESRRLVSDGTAGTYAAATLPAHDGLWTLNALLFVGYARNSLLEVRFVWDGVSAAAMHVSGHSSAISAESLTGAPTAVFGDPPVLVGFVGAPAQVTFVAVVHTASPVPGLRYEHRIVFAVGDGEVRKMSHDYALTSGGSEMELRNFPRDLGITTTLLQSPNGIAPQYSSYGSHARVDVGDLANRRFGYGWRQRVSQSAYVNGDSALVNGQTVYAFAAATKAAEGRTSVLLPEQQFYATDGFVDALFARLTELANELPNSAAKTQMLADLASRDLSGYTLQI